MDFLKDIWKALAGIFKPYEGFQKAVVQEISYFSLGLAMESSKGLGWKGALFIWPFVLALVICVFLLVRIFL